MNTAISLTLEQYFPVLATDWEITPARLHAYYRDLQECREFLAAINDAVRDVPEFSGVQFQHVAELRAYRSLLYLFTRVFCPEVFVETGVLNGFGSAFILLGMLHNGKGTLYSVDLPPADARIFEQGTGHLPQGRGPGWLIPSMVRSHHRLRLGDAKTLLPELMAEHHPLDAFLHDSDHCYTHMMFELSLAWLYLRSGGWLLCDNVEQNTAFSDFARGVSGRERVIASFDSPDRVWKHGLMQKVTQETGSGSALLEP